MAYMMAATATLEAHKSAGSPAGSSALALAGQCLAGARSAMDTLQARSSTGGGIYDKSAAFIYAKVHTASIHCFTI